MTSLEFIEKEIEDKKENVKHWEKQLERYPNDEVFTRGLNKSKEQLQTLQQIKSELVTWEVVEKEFGCPLKVVIEALDKGIIINEEGYINDAYDNAEFNAEEDSYYNCLKLYKAEDDYYFADIEHPYGDSQCGDIGCWVKLSDYQKTWWLKEDKNDN